jgi:hypothetical protein
VSSAVASSDDCTARDHKRGVAGGASAVLLKAVPHVFVETNWLFAYAAPAIITLQPPPTCSTEHNVVSSPSICRTSVSEKLARPF